MDVTPVGALAAIQTKPTVTPAAVGTYPRPVPPASPLELSGAGRHLDTQGDLPSAFSSILADLKAKQQEADADKRRVDFIFDVPVALAHSVVGYRYDRDVPGLIGAVFEVLSGDVPSVSAPPKKVSFLKRLFGT